LLEKYMADQKADTASNTGWLGLAGTLGGGLLGSGVGDGLLSSIYDSIWNMNGLAL
jgi:hypothetical protein